MQRYLQPLSLAALLLAVLLSAGCQAYRDGQTRTIGEVTDDLAIQSRVKLALLNDPDIKGLRINTEVRRGVVTLDGNIASHRLKQRALDLVRSLKGVRSVQDRLHVTAD